MGILTCRGRPYEASLNFASDDSMFMWLSYQANTSFDLVSLIRDKRLIAFKGRIREATIGFIKITDWISHRIKGFIADGVHHQDNFKRLIRLMGRYF